MISLNIGVLGATKPLQELASSFGYTLNTKSSRRYKTDAKVFRLYPDETSSPNRVPSLVPHLEAMGATDVAYLESSIAIPKFPSYTFKLDDVPHEVAICQRNRGHSFESKVADALVASVSRPPRGEVGELVEQLEESHSDFRWADVQYISRGKSNAAKAGLPVEEMASAVGDIVLHADSNWFLSVKDIDGNTFSSYAGAASLFENGTLNPESKGVSFLTAFGVDLNRVQAGYDARNGLSCHRPTHYASAANSSILQRIFERAWGVNYFYARKKPLGWLTFWLGYDKLKLLTSNIVVEKISYPSETCKSITIEAGNHHQRYIVEVRNSKGGEYPNDIKFKVRTK